MSPSSLMVNGNLYLVIILAVLRGYYLSESIRPLSLYIQRMSFCHQTPRTDGYIHSKRGWHAFPYKLSCSLFRIKQGNYGFSPSQVGM